MQSLISLHFNLSRIYLVFPFGPKIVKSIQMGQFPKMEHSTMTTRKQDFYLFFWALLSDDQSHEKNIDRNQMKNESPNHEKAGQPFTDGVLSIFPFRQQKSTPSWNFGTLPAQQGPGLGRKPAHQVNGVFRHVLNLVFDSLTEHQDTGFESLYPTRSHPNQHVQKGREMIHV
ncbi:hypothetical protein KHC33_02115 [Methanospirillum sp. J.3.6.1-F.2.7.3]|uniref:Uncharacterized protein n=1 Tax=Methanospirillum purgamenti TaxID=2834276 RepID=A0A8E7EHT9_9EURY|nr:MULTISPECIES: hypothetical protein [Methanospirillum]MDX8549357.1 hypothetical protein [Methanospirillum hungatei]QVV89352.1 hypothetical protein KHC33_02115 [Methanospirillum sp. J.3.6.1-F.2.7.3]